MYLYVYGLECVFVCICVCLYSSRFKYVFAYIYICVHEYMCAGKCVYVGMYVKLLTTPSKSITDSQCQYLMKNYW